MSTEYPWLMCGDCLERMKENPDGSVDMVLCDPPYGTTASKWDVVIPFAPLWEQYWRVLKPSSAIVLFGSEPFSSYLRLSQIQHYKYDWIWDKVKPTGHLNAKIQPLTLSEQIIVFGKNKIKYFPILEERQTIKRSKVYSISDNYIKTQKIDVLTREYTHKYPKNHIVVSNAHQKGKLHPTQKPVALLEYLIKTYTREDEIVLDNTMGSGATGVACVNTNRKFIGIEKDEKYFSIAKERIAEALAKKAENLFQD